MNTDRIRRQLTGVILAASITMIQTQAASGDDGKDDAPKYRGLIGADSWKIKKEDGKTYIWAGGEKSGPGANWYEFTDAMIPAGKLQFGIGKDRIRSIDDPLFVKPDDPRLLKIPMSPFQRSEKPTTTNDLEVIGYVIGDEVRAYPTALLDHHELVNDRFGAKPVAVGW